MNRLSCVGVGVCVSVQQLTDQAPTLEYFTKNVVADPVRSLLEGGG